MRCFLVASLSLVCLHAQPAVTARPFQLSELRTQPGFEVSVYARIPAGPRFMAFGPNGVLYVAARDNGTIVAVPGPDTTVVAVRGLNQPNSLVFSGNDLYIGAIDAVLRFRDAATPDLVIRSQAERLATLPTAGGGHISRTLEIGADGRMYVAIGSTCNFCLENDTRRAAVTRYEADGTGQTLFARGLRNSVGLAWHPVTGELWGTENGGDGLGDDIPADEINIIRSGNDYGWPDCYGQRIPVAWGSGARPGRCPDTVPPALELQAHSAPLGLSFYTGEGFPEQFRNDAFVAFHGSWNRNQPTGYKVVRVRAAGGRPTAYEDFLWGFLAADSRTWSGRPVHPLPGPDGALYISDDATGNIYRIAYTGPRISAGGVVPRGDRTYEIYGANFTGDIAVFAGAASAEILYLSPSQINVRLPEDAAAIGTLTVRNEKAEDSAPIPPSSQ